METEEKKAPHSPQRYKQQTSIRFDTYGEAKAVRKTYGKGRYRIKARPDGHYDLITYAEV